MSENSVEKAEAAIGVTNKEIEQVTEVCDDKEIVNIVHTPEKEQEKIFIKEKCYRLNKVLRDFGIKAVPITEERTLRYFIYGDIQQKGMQRPFEVVQCSV